MLQEVARAAWLLALVGQLAQQQLLQVASLLAPLPAQVHANHQGGAWFLHKLSWTDKAWIAQ